MYESVEARQAGEEGPTPLRGGTACPTWTGLGGGSKAELGSPFRLLPKVNITGLCRELSKCRSSMERLSDFCSFPLNSVICSWSLGGGGEGRGKKITEVPGGSLDRQQVVIGQEPGVAWG